MQLARDEAKMLNSRATLYTTTVKIYSMPWLANLHICDKDSCFWPNSSHLLTQIALVQISLFNISLSLPSPSKYFQEILPNDKKSGHFWCYPILHMLVSMFPNLIEWVIGYHTAPWENFFFNLLKILMVLWTRALVWVLLILQLDSH